MTATVQISPAVALEEERASNAALRNRNLILAQSVADLKVMIAEKDAELQALKAKETTDGASDNL